MLFVKSIGRSVLRHPSHRSPADFAREILQENPYHSFRQLECRFHDGVLTVCGSVPSFYLKQVAQTALRDVDGVASIDNQNRGRRDEQLISRTA